MIKTDVSLVVPCFNEEEAIPLFYQEAKSVLDKMKKTKSIKTYEYVFVDDGSTDNTLAILRKLAKQDKNIKYVSFSRNFGKEAALLAGLQKSLGEYVATMDVDLQDPPRLLPQMFQAVTEEGYDCAGTRRSSRKGEPLVRSFLSRKFYKVMAHFCKIPVVDGARDYRLMRRRMVEAIVAMPERHRFSKGIFPWVGFSTKWFEYENIERCAGKTKWNIAKLFNYSLEGITAFSTKPLVFASAMGICSLFIALVMIIIIIIRKLNYGDPVAGWPSLVCLILLVSGLQLFTIGILGQYLAKMYIEIKQRPIYIVREDEKELSNEKK